MRPLPLLFVLCMCCAPAAAQVPSNQQPTITLRDANAPGNLYVRGGQGGIAICPELPGRGGNVYIAPGKGGKACTNAETTEFDGDIVFMLANGREMLRLRHDGVILVKKKVVRTDTAVVEGFVDWLRASMMWLGRGTP